MYTIHIAMHNVMWEYVSLFDYKTHVYSVIPVKQYYVILYIAMYLHLKLTAVCFQCKFGLDVCDCKVAYKICIKYVAMLGVKDITILKCVLEIEFKVKNSKLEHFIKYVFS